MQKKVFFVYCRFAQRHNLFSFTKKGDEAFTVKGFDNFKKVVEKFEIHEKSASHMEAKMKWSCLNNPSIKEQVSIQAAQVLSTRRAGILKQLEAMNFLLRQGIALQGHSEEGNLPQLLTTSASDNPVVKCWLEEGKYMSHDIANELTTSMGQKVLRQLLEKIKSCDF